MRAGAARIVGRSLRGYLLLPVALSIVAPLAVYLALGGYVANAFFEREFAARGETVVQGVAENSVTFLRAAEVFVEAIASDDSLLRDRDVERLRGHLREELSLNDNFESLACLDGRGFQLASFPPDPNADGLLLADRDFAHPEIGLPFVSESRISLSSGHPVVAIAARLHERGPVIVGSLDLSRLSDFIDGAGGPGWALSVADRAGTVVADHDKSRVRQRVNIRNILPPEPAGSGGAARREGTSRVIAFSRPLPDFGWHVVGTYDEAVFFAPLERSLSLFLASATAAILLFGALALFMTKPMLRDLEALGSSVRAIRDRRYGEATSEPVFAEFRELIGDMRAMESAVEEREAQLRGMVNQRDTLLREVHHRVKNNMQIVSSLLTLQKDSVEDLVAIDALTESITRIQALALTHEVLYRSEDFARIDIEDYFRELCSFLFSAYRASGVEFSLTGGGITMDLDRAIPLGLVVTEIVSNSLKHAFKGRPGGRVSLELGSSADEISILAADDGSGFEAEDGARTLGLILIDSLVAQIHGRLTRSNGSGTSYSIVLPRPSPSP